MNTEQIAALDRKLARRAKVTIISNRGNEDHIELDEDRYIVLLNALRNEERRLKKEADDVKFRAIYRDRIEDLLKRRDAVIDVLCSLDI